MSAHDHIFKNRQSCCCLHCIPAADAGILDVPVVAAAAAGPSAVAIVAVVSLHGCLSACALGTSDFGTAILEKTTHKNGSNRCMRKTFLFIFHLPRPK